ncbi:MAG: YhbY family RNA-binding protein, partial [Clostridia bacterium]|nr:YhbY family RNA-binding protein [Clostridia bacterium]
MLSKVEIKNLKSMASLMPISEHIGKDGLSKAVIEQIDKNLTANELCKVKVLPNSMLDTKEVLQSLALSLKAEPIQDIGRNVILYRFSPNKKQ